MKFSKVDGCLMPIDSKDQAEFAEIGENQLFECSVINDNQITTKQLSSLNLFCQLLAEELNANNWDMKRFFTIKPEIEAPWTLVRVKETLWRPVQIALKNKHSTTDLKRADPDEIHKVLMKKISEETGVYVPWPANKDPGY